MMHTAPHSPSEPLHSGSNPYLIEPHFGAPATAVWLSPHRKELRFSQQEGYRPIRFESSSALMQYVRDRVQDGFLVG